MKAVFLLATRNPKKGRELERLLKGLAVRFMTMDRFPRLPKVREDAATFRGNAAKKAVANSRRTILPVVAEDSGLQVRALGGRPGVRTARFAGSDQDDRKNNDKLLQLLRGLPDSRRQARFVCVVAVAVGGRLIRTFEGNCPGRIAARPAGRGGFGYDPLFIPKGFNRTMSQLGSAVKDRVSHRARAVRQLRAWLRKYL